LSKAVAALGCDANQVALFIGKMSATSDERASDISVFI